MHIHCLGIGGIGVSAIAQILYERGESVTGSDIEASAITEHLQKRGIPVDIGYEVESIAKQNPDLIIHSLALEKNHPALKLARRKKIPLLSYPEAVGKLTREFFTIAICGTHGKSTITALISKMLIENNFDPTVIVGTKLKELNGQNYRVGKSKILVLEACEYKRAFLNYHPRVIVLHTLDPDHLDYYRDFNDYLHAFGEFAMRLPNDGYFFANLDDEDVHQTLQLLQAKKFPPHNLFTYSSRYASSDFYLMGEKIIQRNARVGELHLKIPGEHNRSNALAAFAVGATLGIAPPDILKSLNHYEGALRRFEVKGKFGKTLFIDDYAHHPVEIQATLQAARERFPKEKICVVFQPHQYNRTKNLLKEFAASFEKADSVIIPNIYEVRDRKEDTAAVSTEKLVKEIRKRHRHVENGNGLEKTAEWLKKHAKKFDVVFTMGAGDVWKIAEKLL
ncbi:UDP-N-acetylmuramate--L-alanine ligase [Candidatus Peregrinibacteria bacterium]|nr:UDP-N-acetylmuramate--L-alanine ligase [Candidatus Peregrinibacteria bacterium]